MPFKKGQSGNPKGRPKGAQDKVSREARSLFIHIMEGEVGHIQDALDGCATKVQTSTFVPWLICCPTLCLSNKNCQSSWTLNLPSHHGLRTSWREQIKKKLTWAKMSDVLYHATGLCGEHWHPNVINVTALCLTLCIACRWYARRSE